MVLSAIIALGASADALTVKSGKLLRDNINLTSLKAIHQIEGNALNANDCGIELLSFTKKSSDSETVKPKTAGRAINTSDIEGDWELTYINSSNATVTETVTLEYDSYYEEMSLTIPGQNAFSSIPFGGDFDEEAGTLTFRLVNWGSNGSYYVFQTPLLNNNPQNSIVLTYNPESQSFDIPAGAGIGIYAASSVQPSVQLVGAYWRCTFQEMVRPDGDYKVSVEFQSEHHAANEFVFTVSYGADIKSAYAVRLPLDISASQFLEILGEAGVKQMGQSVQAGSYSLKPAASMEKSGYYTVMLFGYDEAGTLRKSTEAAVYVNLPDDDYQTIGTLAYKDNIVSQVYTSGFSYSANVTLQESVTTPGKFRLVNAYSGHQTADKDGCEHYIYLDITDPAYVEIHTSSTGLDLGDGLFVIGTYGEALGYETDEAKEAGIPAGTLNGRTMTFPAQSILAKEQYYNGVGTWGYGNYTSATVITLPDCVLKVTVLDNETDNNPVEGATVTVEGVEATTGADGVATLTLPADVDYLQLVSGTVKYEAAEKSFNTQLTGVETQDTAVVGLTTGIDNVVVVGAEAEVEYYNLLGVRVLNPAAGQMVIKRQGDTVTKTIIK